MGTQLPTLDSSGAVTLESVEQLQDWWDQWVAKGALAVIPQRELAPLEQLEVHIGGLGLTPIVVRCEVVRLDPVRTLLRLLDPVPARPVLPAPVEEIPLAAPIIVATPPPEELPLAAPIIVATPPPTFDDAMLMPDPMSSAPPLERFATPGPQVLPPEALAQLREAAVGPATPVAIGPPAIELEPLAPSARAIPVVEAEHEPPPIVLEPFTPAPVAVQAAPEPAPAPRPMRAALPPYFSGDALRFATVEDFAGNRQHLEGVGAILAVADGQLPVKPVEVRLIVGERETRTKVKVTLSAAGPGTAVVQAADKGGFLPLLRELEAPAARVGTPGVSGPLAGLDPSATSRIPATAFAGLDAAPTGAASEVAAPRAFTLPKRGEIRNPTTPAEILGLPMGRSPTPAEIERPSVPLLLRWIRSTKGVLRLEATADEHPVYTAIFVDGREVRTPASLATLAKSLSLPSMSYTLIDLGRPPEMTTRGRTLHLIGEVIRALSARIDVGDLHQAFPAKPERCVRAVQHVVDSLGFPAQHARLVKADLDGTEFLDEVARAAVGARTVWETLYLLQVFDGISWDDPPAGKATSSRTGTQRTLSAAQIETALDEWAPFEGKDHFHILGLHWSAAPSEIAPAYQKVRAEYGSGGIKRPTNAQTADKIMKRIEDAYRVLSDGGQRRAYRREKYNLVWAHQAKLLVEKAKLELYRKNYQDAKNILDAAEDISSSEEAKALLTALTQAQRKGRD